MTTFDREERFTRGCLALAGLRDMLTWMAPGAAIQSERMAALVELIEQDIRKSATPSALHGAHND